MGKSIGKCFTAMRAASVLPAKMQPLRAQISAESLFVFLIFLSIFAIALAAASNLNTAVQKRLDSEISQSAFSELSGKISDACALGNGNVRMVELSRGRANLSAQGKTLSFTSASFSSSKTFNCEIVVQQSGPASAFRVENIEGIIEIS